MVEERSGRARLARPLAVVAAVLVGVAGIGTSLTAAEEPELADLPLDLDALDPVPLSTWGVVGVGQTLSKQQLQVWDFEQIDDRVFVAGSFTHVQEHAAATPIAQPYLAAFDLDTGDYVPEFAPVFDRTVYTLAVHDGRLIVGGEFTSVNGVAREGVVGLDPATGATDASMPFHADRPFNPTKPAIVRSLELDGDMLYIGGNYNYINNGTGNARTRSYGIGRVNLATDKLDAWAPRSTGSGIWDIAIDPARDRVSFVGFFTAIDAMPDTDHMATVSRTTGLLVPGLTPHENNNEPKPRKLVTIAYANDLLFVGGTEHIAQVLDADTNDRVGHHHAGTGCESFYRQTCDPVVVGGGDFQILEAIDGYVLGGCHCFGPWAGNEEWADSVHYSSIGDKWDADKYVVPIDASSGGDASDWVPDLRGNATHGTWAIFADTNGCLYLGGDYKNKGPLGFSAWLGGFAKFCPTANAPEVEATSSSTDVFLSWTEPSSPVAVTRYRLSRDGVFIGSRTALDYTDPGLTAGAVHDYTVQAVFANGTRSAQSAPASVVVAPVDTTAPDVPTGLDPAVVDETSASFTWGVAADDQLMKAYLVYRDFRYVGRVLATEPLEFTDAGLVAGTTYRYQVRSKDYAGNISGPSVPLSITTLGGGGPDVTAPTVPAGLAIDAVGDQTVTISWDASTDDDSGVKAYLVYRDWKYVGRTLAANGLDFTDAGLTNGQSYRYEVRAKDFAGNISSPSTPVFATPVAG